MIARSVLALLLVSLFSPSMLRAQSNAIEVVHSLTLNQALDLAIRQNADVLRAREDLRRSHGVVVETRSEALPRLHARGEYRETDVKFIDAFPGSGGPSENQERPWYATVEITQLLFAGGRVRAALQVARLSDQIAVLDFERTVADTIFVVRRTFYEVLLNMELVKVREQSIHLLDEQLKDTRNRFDVGAVPQFNVLRAEVELANAKPPLIRARNALRLAKENLVKLTALDDPQQQPEFTNFEFVGDLRRERRDWSLADALRLSSDQRAEIKQAEKRVKLQRENTKIARSGYLPEVSAFANYGVRNTLFGDQVDESIHGWSAGGRASWNIFDGMQTHGRLQQARADLAAAEITAADTRRVVGLEVRQAYSDYQQATELIEAQARTVEQAEEGLRLAEARFRAGSGTQLDVLSAQTALTEARSNEAQAAHDYNVALSALDRATGITVAQPE